MPNQEELIEIIINSLERLDTDDQSSDKLASYLYVADSRIAEHIEKLQQLLEEKKPSPQQLRFHGVLLEQIVYLAFQGLKGATSFKSFQSPGPQYDLLVSGDDQKWHTVCKQLYLDIHRRDIVVEAKAKNEKLPDKDFARLCSLMDLNLTGSGLGIFFTLKGATGFPERGDSIRQRAIRDCRFRQVLFHAKTQKFIVVLDKDEIFELGKNGTLIQILIRKIRDLRELTGLPASSVLQLQEIDLPSHLQRLYEDHSSTSTHFPE